MRTRRGLRAGSRLSPALTAAFVFGPLRLLHYITVRTVGASRLFEAAGLPAGTVNLVPSDREAADHLVHSKDIDKVTFTGSSAAGMHIASVCGANMTRCTLELGGKSAAIIRDDFSTDVAAQILGNTITVMSGQVCAMLSRAIVPRSRHDELAEKIAAVMKQVKICDPNDPATQLGPLAMRRQRDRVEMYIEEGKKTADLVTGGQRPAHLNQGYFIEPTLFANVDNTSRIAQEEIFGPVLTAIPFRDEEEAIAIANDVEYGLAGYLWTNNLARAISVSDRLEAGMIWVNSENVRHLPTPFGGMKQSGLGREGSKYGIDDFLEIKYVCVAGI